ncbi:AMP-dependent synthetase/ligase [Rhizosphaericola mali]|uniref:Long-chain fatty acid--CoA ligase n=1 Tax=Rhizosphaericola mali TaxID=2545455 RepID=A0A5P2G867_9BACT|nr:long-chain fatty acid--CoA ligase [Rhizosphaericola mali]QES89413.1 long-chain fatty acid--CoA ligase [Rhizosphaericola mali]
MISNATRLFDVLMPGNIEKLPEKLLCYKKNGEWTYYTPTKTRDLAFGLASYFISEKYNQGSTAEEKSKIGLICFSRPNWLVVDFAAQLTGALLVPLYPNISASEIIHIFNETEIKICFVGNMELYNLLESLKPEIPTLKRVYVFDDPTPENNWENIVHPFTPEVESKVSQNAKEIGEDDIATIIYTSGTTGMPKGVMLTHKNILSNVIMASQEVFSKFHLKQNKSLSFLPLNHILEKMLMYVYLYNEFSVSFAENIEKVAQNLQEVKPYVFVTVPRLLEKVYEKILQKGQELTGWKKNLFFWSIKLANQYDISGNNPFLYKLKLFIADKLIYSKWRAALGGNVQAIVVGGAACQQRLIKIFGAAKIVILEGYGLTETSPVIAVNRYENEDRKLGTVGRILKGVQVKFLEDGEILCKGDNVMKGYYKRPNETEEALADGWFHTGDIGEMENGFLKITDRKKEFLKTSGGKYVAPQPIENKLKENFLIEQIMLVGDSQKFVSALIVPNFPSLKEWASKHNIPFNNNQDLIKLPQVIEQYQAIIDKYNPSFNHVEQIKKFTLIADEWTVESGDLTPSVKMKRKVITKKYADLIAKFYEEKILV